MGGQVTVRLNLNSAGYSAEMAKAARTMRQFSDSTKEMGHGTVSQMQAASASIRLIEGDMTRNVRAVERFITTLPGVGTALKAAFPLVGAAATVGILARIGDEAAKTVQKVIQAPQVISNSFRELALGAESSIDALRLSTAQMNEQIALLTGKRPNELAIELGEASVPEFSLGALQVVMACAIRCHHPELTWEQAQALVTLQSASTIALAVAAALEAGAN